VPPRQFTIVGLLTFFLDNSGILSICPIFFFLEYCMSPIGVVWLSFEATGGSVLFILALRACSLE